MTIPRRLVRLILLFLISAAALCAGLMPSLLRTGRVDPFDWLVPALAALGAIAFILWRKGAPSPSGALLGWSLVAMPPLLLCLLVASTPPWSGMLLLAVTLALSLVLLRTALAIRARQGWVMLALWAALLIAGRFVFPHIDRPATVAAPAHMGLMSALALANEGPSAPAGTPTATVLMRDIGTHAPLWQALAADVRIAPLDTLDLPVLRGLDGLLLAQPRLLTPAELVALDRWVRDGGHVVILADPLLHWADPRPLGHPARAPITSLLDPLLRHWGLTLEPARANAMVERHILAGGALLQLVGASRFTLAANAPCMLTEQGLIATCRIGKGEARLVADADWANDALWTLAPGRPLDRSAWTSDAIPTLTHFLNGTKGPVQTAGPWLKDEMALVSGLRLALIMSFMLAMATASAAFPTPAQVRKTKNKYPAPYPPQSVP